MTQVHAPAPRIPAREPVEPASGHLRGHRARRLHGIAGSVDRQRAFPALERSFPSDPRATLAWVITSYGIVFGSLLVIAGRTADRLGSRRVFFAGLTVFTAGRHSAAWRRRWRCSWPAG